MSGWGSIYNNTRTSLQHHVEELARLQEMAASGARLRRASDAPADAFRLLGLRDDSRSMEIWQENLAGVNDSLTVAWSVIGEMVGSLTRVRELATQGVNGTYSADNRRIIASEINSLLEQVLSLANTSYGGRYLFSGSNTDSAPYVSEHEGGNIASVTYVGSRQAVEVPVAPGVDYAATLVGDEIFRNDVRQPPVFLGQTGAGAGAGTPNVRGDVWLTVSHGTTTYLGASGIAAGDSSDAGDTILGNGHTLTIDAPNGTLRLDNGPVVTFTPGDTNVMVESTTGQAYVSTAVLDGGFVGTVNIQATGNLSIDDGASQTAIDFADTDLAVADSATGRVLYVDCTDIDRTGLEPVRVPGTYDLFGTLVTIRDLLLNERDLPEGQMTALLNETSDAMNEVSQGLVLAQASVSAGIGVLGTLDESLESRKAQTDEQAALLEDADIVQVAIQLARQQALYEMTLASASRLLRLSLFDYI